ncbi:MAG: type II toxin-antitoxin system HicB family antitoxin [Methanoregula sp.]|jgi:predicted RNase H-like HicB family nuclease|uniref:type II toxin-antitoxin system HicB family antitoxin n=1 Tax=Methanoregula sp. TaxID=2052170 RepID=UPI003D0EEE5A
MEYSILIHKAGEGGFWSEVPALPGCFSQGETIEETIVNTKEAAELIISCLMEDNREIPVEDEFTIYRVCIDSVPG